VGLLSTRGAAHLQCVNWESKYQHTTVCLVGEGLGETLSVPSSMRHVTAVTSSAGADSKRLGSMCLYFVVYYISLHCVHARVCVVYSVYTT